jgi:hypothetical protein
MVSGALAIQEQFLSRPAIRFGVSQMVVADTLYRFARLFRISACSSSKIFLTTGRPRTQRLERW